MKSLIFIYTSSNYVTKSQIYIHGLWRHALHSSSKTSFIMVDFEGYYETVREWVEDNFIVSIIIGSAAICLCCAICIGCCCCCRFWRNNKKRRAHHDKVLSEPQTVPMSPVQHYV